MNRRIQTVFAFSAVLLTTSVSAEVFSVDLVKENSEGDLLSLNHWFENGWVIQKHENLVQIEFKNTEFEITNSPVSPESLSNYLSGFGHELQGGSTFLRFEMNCDCSLLVDSDGATRVSIQILGDGNKQPPSKVVAAATSTSGSGLPPIPPKKPPYLGEVAGQGQQEQPAVDAQEARKRLLEQLLRAAEAGIVDFDEKSSDEAQDVDVAEDDNSGPEQFANASSLDPSNPDGDVATTTKSDSNIEQNATNSQIANAEEVGGGQIDDAEFCHEEGALSFPDVPDSNSFLEAISEIRSKLVGEFDEVNEEAVKELVRLQIAAGLTVEATATISELMSDTVQSRLYADISSLLDGKSIHMGSSLRNEECGDDQTLWLAFVNAREGHHDKALAAEAMTGRALERLPSYLREIVSTALGVSSSEQGDWEKARLMEAIAIRSEDSIGDSRHQTNLLSARLAEWHDDDAKLNEVLGRALQGEADTAKRALLEMARRRITQNDLTTQEADRLAQDLGILGRMEDGSRIGSDAYELYLKALEKFKTKQQIIDELMYGIDLQLLPEHKHGQILSELFNGTLNEYDDLSLGLAFLEDTSEFATSIERQDFRRKLARSLAELGVPALGAEILRPGDSDEETALTLAMSFLELDAGNEARNIARQIDNGEVRALIEAVSLVDNKQSDLAAEVLDSYEPNSSRMDLEATLWEAQLSRSLIKGDTGGALFSAERLYQISPSSRNKETLAVLRSSSGIDNTSAVQSVELPSNSHDLSELASILLPDLSSKDAKQSKAESELIEVDEDIKFVEGFLSDG